MTCPGRWDRQVDLITCIVQYPLSTRPGIQLLTWRCCREVSGHLNFLYFLLPLCHLCKWYLHRLITEQELGSPFQFYPFSQPLHPFTSKFRGLDLQVILPIRLFLCIIIVISQHRGPDLPSGLRPRVSYVSFICSYGPFLEASLLYS